MPVELTPEEQLANLRKLLDVHKDLTSVLDGEIKTAKAGKDTDEARALLQEKFLANQKVISELQSQYVNLSKEERELLRQLQKEQKGITEQVEKERKSRDSVNAVLRQYNLWLKTGLDYLMQSDKVIKSTILSLGLSGAKAADMRLSFEQSADFVAKLGGSIEDIGKIMQGYADETGEARALTSEMVQDVTMIGKGTALGVEQATKLAGQFRFMGLDAKSTMNMVQGIVDTSERMGVNTTKVLKNVNDNFKKLNTYTFIKGSKGMAEMAINAERTRVSIEDTLSAAEKGRTLEGAIDMMAQLQVMGGSFAENDPLQWMHDTRNDPDKITEQISQMTKGIVVLRKKSDGTFDKFMSPADRDRLNGAAKALGISLEDMTQIAQKRFDIDTMNRNLSNKGLSGREKQLVEGAAIFNTENAKYEVMLAGKMRDISSLTQDEAKSFAKQQVLLKDRARDAMTFEEVFKATMNEMKSALLPLLNVINKVLVGMRPVIDTITKVLVEGKAGWLKVAAAFMGVGLLWKGILTPLAQNIGGKTIGRMATFFRGKGGVAKGIEESTEGALKGGAGAGGGLLKGGAGVGAAGLGVGAGIGIAATGIGALAKAIKDVDVDKLKQMNASLAILGGTMAIILVAGVIALGTAGEFAAPGLIALGIAAVGVGFGINLAAKGVGKMAEGLGDMIEKAKGAGPAMLEVGEGIGMISMSMLGMTAGIGGVVAFSLLMNRISKHAPDLERVGVAFKQIDSVLSGKKEDYEAILNVIEKISKINTSSGSIFADLKDLLKSPLKVKFDENAKANFAINVDSHIDSTKVASHNLIQQVAVGTAEMKNSKR